MKKLYTLILLYALLVPGAIAQNDYRIMLHSGAVSPQPNLEQFISESSVIPTGGYENYYYRLIQFNEIPNEMQQAAINSSGIRLLGYLPYKTFIAGIPLNYNTALLRNFNVRSVVKQDVIQKINSKILGLAPDYARIQNGFTDLDIMYYGNIPFEKIYSEANAIGTVIGDNRANHVISVRVPEDQIHEIASLPWIFYMDAISAPSTPDDVRGRSLHRSNTINASYLAGRHYNGSGVAAALADDGFVGPHIDFTGRITNHTSIVGNTHGDMTGGILAGAGNLNPEYPGMANGAQLHVFDINGYPQIVNAVSNNANYGTVVSSTSYSQGCNQYTTDTQFGDQLTRDNPQLLFVFSAGNNQSGDCNYGAGAGWGNITGGYKQGKNVIACANLSSLEILDNTSSRGPASDGRIKPDISSNGQGQMSTNENNTYQTGGGTSAACPGIAGISTQLIQAYKDLNSAANAPTALIKACLLNSAEDIGNPGPDYTYGWGRVNALRAVQTLEENRYFNATISQGGSNQHVINVPSDVNQLRVMIYWHDQGGNPAAIYSLVNDLDMQVTDPSSVSWNPWVLDPTPVVANLTAPAVRNPDHLNNVEQVTIDNPSAGAYTVNVNGFAVPSGPQEYYLVYEFRKDEITVTYPAGGEGFAPGTVEIIRWDALKGLGNFTLQYSINDGATWNLISSAVNQNTLQYSWTVPAAAITGQARIRVSRGSASGMSAEKFAIIAAPTNLSVGWACPDSVNLTWTGVTGAAWYEVSMLGAMYMDSIGTSTTTSFTATGINPVNGYWFSCRAVFANGVKGRRCIAIYKAPGTLNCPIAFDVELAQVNNPPFGTLFACQNLAAVPITVTLANKGINAVSNIPVVYTLNGGSPVNGTYTGTIQPGNNAQFTFPGTVDLSAPLTYNFQFWVDYSGDMNHFNDTITGSSTTFATGTIPLIEPFATLAFPPNAWSIDNGGQAATWQLAAGIVGSTGTATNAAYFDNFSTNDPGAEDGLTTLAFDLTSAVAPKMTFDVAYARYSAAFSDTLRIDISTNCGVSYTPSGYLKGGLGLATAGTLTSIFTPTTSTQWRNDTVNLAAYAGNIVMAKFVNICRYGNSLFIDNVNISDVVGISENVFNGSVSVSPNPSTGLFNLNLSLSKPEELTISLLDVTGKLVGSNKVMVSGSYHKLMDLRSFAKGMYSLIIRGQHSSYQTKIAVY